MLKFVHLRAKSTRAAFVLLATAGIGCAAPVDENDDPSLASTSAELSLCIPDIPEALVVPEGNRLAFVLEAEGVQIYDCKVAADGSTSWVFRAPEADLFARHGKLAGSHYVGPTWEALDGSTVVGARLAGATVDATAIPWLLLQATSHGGDGHMAKVSYIQRLSTSGGLAPSSGCDATLVGASAEVEYTATYTFYEPKLKRIKP